MERIKNLKGVTGYVVWALIGLVIGVLFALVTRPFFTSGSAYTWPVFGVLTGFMQAFYFQRRKNKPNHE